MILHSGGTARRLRPILMLILLRSQLYCRNMRQTDTNSLCFVGKFALQCVILRRVSHDSLGLDHQLSSKVAPANALCHYLIFLSQTMRVAQRRQLILHSLAEKPSSLDPLLKSERRTADALIHKEGETFGIHQCLVLIKVTF